LPRAKIMQTPRAEPMRCGRVGRVPPAAKLALAFAAVLLTVLLPRKPDPLYAVPAAILLGAVVACRVSPIYLLRRLLWAEFFILGIAILSLFSPETRPVCLAVLLKSNLCVTAMLLLTWTTPFHEILRVLRRLRLPAVMLATLALMSRYLPVLGEEARRMERARASRTYGGGRRVIWRSLATVLGQLFIRSADRAERIYLAMTARGWK